MEVKKVETTALVLDKDEKSKLLLISQYMRHRISYHPSTGLITLKHLGLDVQFCLYLEAKLKESFQ